MVNFQTHTLMYLSLAFMYNKRQISMTPSQNVSLMIDIRFFTLLMHNVMHPQKHKCSPDGLFVWMINLAA